MAFGHERLDVYRVSQEYVRWAFDLCERLKGKNRHARDQRLRASQTIPLNMAEGNGKATSGDRRRYFEIARGSALECAAIQDVLVVCRGRSPAEKARSKEILDRVVAMLTKLGQRGYSTQEISESCGIPVDTDADSDTDPDSYSIRCRQQSDTFEVGAPLPILETDR